MASADVIREMRHPGGDPFTRRRLFGWSRYPRTPREMLIEMTADRTGYERRPDGTGDCHDPWAGVRRCRPLKPLKTGTRPNKVVHRVPLSN